MIKVKKGYNFSVALQFTEEEWDSIFPIDEIVSEFKQNNRYSTLEIDVDEETRCIFVKAETDDWSVGTGYFDIKITKDGVKQAIPELTNIEVQIVQGITR